MFPLAREAKCPVRCALLIAFVAIAGSSWELLAQGPADNDGLVSNAVGLLAIQRIVSDHSLQQALEISPSQLVELRSLLESEKVQSSPKQGFFDRSVFPHFPDSIIERQAYGVVVTFEESVDGLVAKEAPKILHPQQVEGLRVSYLRERLRFPSVALSSPYLAQLGLKRSQIEDVTLRFIAPSKRVEEECIKVRSRAIATLLSFLPEKSADRFSKCFGSKYVPAARSKESFDVSSVGVFEVDREFRPLSVLAFEELGLHQKAMEETDRIRRASFGRNIDIHEEVKEALQALASPTQYKAVFESLHLGELEHDLRCITQPRVLQFLEIPPNLLEKTRSECERLQQEIDSVRLELEVPILESVYGELPQNTREKLSWMYDGVWCELE